MSNGNEYYKQQLYYKEKMLKNARLDDYHERGELKAEIEMLKNRIKGIPGYEAWTDEQLEEERRRLDKQAYGNSFLIMPTRAGYAQAKIRMIREEQDRRRKEAKKNQEIVSDIFTRSDFVSEEKPPVKTETIDDKVFRELSEFTAQALKELYRYGMDYDLIKNACGRWVIPVIGSPYAEDENYLSFTYFSSGSYVYRMFRSGEQYTDEEYKSINSERDYRELRADTRSGKHLCSINMTLQQLGEKFVAHVIRADYRSLTKRNMTANLIRSISEIYYTRRASATAMDEMKDLIKNYLLSTIKLGANPYE